MIFNSVFNIIVLPELFKQQGDKKGNDALLLCNQNKIEDIKTKQAESAENLIHLQFKMEQLVYCQDQIYSGILQKVREETLNPPENSSQTASFKFTFSKTPSSVSSITEIGVHLNAYFSVSMGAHGLCWGVLIEGSSAERTGGRYWVLNPFCLDKLLMYSL